MIDISLPYFFRNHQTFAASRYQPLSKALVSQWCIEIRFALGNIPEKSNLSTVFHNLSYVSIIDASVYNFYPNHRTFAVN